MCTVHVRANVLRGFHANSAGAVDAITHSPARSAGGETRMHQQTSLSIPWQRVGLLGRRAQRTAAEAPSLPPIIIRASLVCNHQLTKISTSLVAHPRRSCSHCVDSMLQDGDDVRRREPPGRAAPHLNMFVQSPGVQNH